MSEAPAPRADAAAKTYFYEPAAASPLMRCGYLSDYAVINEMIKIKRPPQIPASWPYARPQAKVD